MFGWLLLLCRPAVHQEFAFSYALFPRLLLAVVAVLAGNYCWEGGGNMGGTSLNIKWAVPMQRLVAIQHTTAALVVIASSMLRGLGQVCHQGDHLVVRLFYLLALVGVGGPGHTSPGCACG